HFLCFHIEIWSVWYNAEEERKGGVTAADIEVVDGPNDEGEAFARPGKLCDPFRRSHQIERAAIYCKLDLFKTIISSLLAGSRHPTAGVIGNILKEKGKDVVTFLSWATEPEMEERRRLMGFKWIFVLSLLHLQAACYRRLNGSVLKSRKMALNCVS
ncbi:unnamed protein product, partial [Musa hybrid cultivar]